MIPRRKHVVIATATMVVAMATGPLFNAGTAVATTATYPTRLNEEIPRVLQQYGPDALVREGGRVCDWASQGVSDTSDGGIVDRVVRDLPMSWSAASWVQILAEDELGC